MVFNLFLDFLTLCCQQYKLKNQSPSFKHAIKKGAQKLPSVNQITFRQIRLCALKALRT